MRSPVAPDVEDSPQLVVMVFTNALEEAWLYWSTACIFSWYFM